MSELKSEDQTVEDSDLVDSVDEEIDDSDDNLDDVNEEDEEDDEEESDYSNDEEYEDEYDDTINKNDCVYDSEYLDSVMNEEKESEIKVPDNERITHPILTKYERVRILGVRAKQIADGAKIMIKINNKELMSSMEIAEIELKNKVTPFIIKRPIGNNKVEHWKISELEQIDYQ